MPDNYNNYNKELKDFARKLRNNSTLAEVILWDKLLKKKQLRNYQFLRQRSIDIYIVDFFCKDLKLVIEVDGTYHLFNRKKDRARDEDLNDLGFTVIHFNNEEILNDLLSVQRTIERFIDEYEKGAK
ncbi:MAG: endonuclease domain-containing protein [Prolixibacteraceae bacterium]|nr:endonuclease domain-containing protein [Prolixibacteraceae bacterium]